MSEVNVNEAIQRALETQWPKVDGNPAHWNVGARPVTEFDTSKLQLRLISLDYPDLDEKLLRKPVLINTTEVDNPSNAEVTREVGYEPTFTDAYEWNITAGLTLSASATFKTGLPIIGEGEVTTGVELSFTGGYTNSHSEQVTFKDTTTVHIPPQTSVEIKTILLQGSVEAVPFTATVEAYGSVGAYTAYGASDGHLDFFSWQWADLDTGVGWTDPGFKKVAPLKDASVRRFVVEGLFSAVCGFTVRVVVEPVAALAQRPAETAAVADPV